MGAVVSRRRVWRPAWKALTVSSQGILSCETPQEGERNEDQAEDHGQENARVDVAERAGQAEPPHAWPFQEGRDEKPRNNQQDAEDSDYLRATHSAAPREEAGDHAKRPADPEAKRALLVVCGTPFLTVVHGCDAVRIMAEGQRASQASCFLLYG